MVPDKFSPDFVHLLDHYWLFLVDRWCSLSSWPGHISAMEEKLVHSRKLSLSPLDIVLEVRVEVVLVRPHRQQCGASKGV